MGHSLLSLLAPITHSQRYAQTASLARSAALIRSLTRSLRSSWERCFCLWVKCIDFIPFQPTAQGHGKETGEAEEEEEMSVVSEENQTFVS